jgi:hypothetical protein
MTLRLLAGAAVSAALVLPLTAHADPVPPACVVVDQEPLHAQVGYAPNGPTDCTHLP